ncbi:MAG: nitrous oxide-stimulated promoter family protein [Phocaeicola sp.]|nr:nitrous oxide-stimulated promoter family protein [Phocaeicola sp.]MDY5938221.1 nitrous oxide-stimulated promoter family protein [Phocaeicola sp.]
MKKYSLAKEKKIIETMIRLYCRKKEGNKTLCASCTELLAYANERIDRCKIKQTGITCKVCPIHCYNPLMREKIREVMRYAGPRMILYHPIMAFSHLYRELTKKYLSR